MCGTKHPIAVENDIIQITRLHYQINPLLDILLQQHRLFSFKLRQIQKLHLLIKSVHTKIFRNSKLGFANTEND